MPTRRLVLSIPGLSRALLASLPPGTALQRLAASHPVSDLVPTWPAVTCSVQASLTTGVSPSAHGIIANGFATYRGEAHLTDSANLTNYRTAVSFWEQSNQFLDAPRAWQGKGLKTALLFFQHCMPGFSGELQPAADIVVTPKPEHGPDGKITSLLWSNPPTLALELQKNLGPFPLMHYWGPMANLKSSGWIISAALAVWESEKPDLQLTYIPHLDYDLQRFGPDSPQAHKAVQDLATALEPLIAGAQSSGAELVILSEYAIDAVDRAIAPNRLLHEAGLLKLTTNAEGPQIDYALSPAWAMCDHQIAHVYLRPDADRDRVATVLKAAGIEILSPAPIQNRRAGDLQIQAPKGAWLDYRWWSNPADAPAWAATVDIHRKPGYDPLELFFNPATRTIIDDTSRIAGSHGRVPPHATPGIFLSSRSSGSTPAPIAAVDVARVLIAG